MRVLIHELAMTHEACWSPTRYETTRQPAGGAFQGEQTTANVGSGLGCINNTLLFDHPQKVVMRVPFNSATSVSKPLSKMGLPVWGLAPLAGLIVGGVSGLFRAIFRRA